MMQTPMWNDPCALVWAAFRNLYPDAKCRCEWWHEPLGNLPRKLFRKRWLGRTIFGDGITVVQLSSSLQAVDMGEILAHELAHVVTPDDIDHGADWDKAFSAIQAEYFRIGIAVVEGRTEMNRRVSDER